MAKKESKELAKTEPTRTLPTLWDVDKLFDELVRRPFSFMGLPRVKFPGEEGLTPSVDIFEEKGDVVVKAELPGINKEDIDITLTEDTITIAGEKKKEEETTKKDYYRYECSYGSFNRTFTLPTEVQTDKVKTKFKDGVLELRMPKTEEAKKKEKKIKIE
ncbi:MAG: Spore protein SP21 [Syntrophorhabdus sp. PtaU1.Bin002]|nr:MAG: Spore protein SP21 [Syntrophorhabdus sp. PtaU1.Bin002]